eukprot:3119161-Amphidinium_carterae.1
MSAWKRISTQNRERHQREPVELRLGWSGSFDELITLLMKDVSALELLSKKVRQELRYELHQPVLVVHALFRLVDRIDSGPVD